MAMLNINNHGVGGRVMPDEMSKVIHDFIRPDFLKSYAELMKRGMMRELRKIVHVIQFMIYEWDYDVEAAGGWGIAILHAPTVGHDLREDDWFDYDLREDDW